jgi:hypothetical protein
MHILAGHVRFVPAHRQSDNATSSLSPAKWPVEFVLVFKETDRGAFVSHDRIITIIAPAIQATGRLIPAKQI